MNQALSQFEVRRATIIGLAVIGSLWLPVLAAAQPEPIPTRTRTDAGEVREAKPEIFYLRDQRGNLVYVPSIPFEEYEEYLKQRRGLSVATAPEFSFVDEIKLTGLMVDQIADVEVTLTVRLNETQANSDATAAKSAPEPKVPPEPPEAPPVPKPPDPIPKSRESKWVRVPLRMASAVLVESPTFEGEGKYSVGFDPGEGYFVWIRGPEGSQHSIRMHFSTTINFVGNEKRIALRLPSTPSRLTMRVPGTTAVGNSLSPGTTLLKPERGASGTSFVMVGASGEFQLSWKEGTEAIPEKNNVLDAVGTVLVRVEGRRRVRADARFRVRSYSQPIQTIRMRLPAGLRYYPDPTVSNAADYQIVIADSDAPELEDPAPRQQLVFRFNRESNSPPEIRFGAEWLETSPDATLLEIGGFEIEDAIRHTGAIEIAVEADVNVRWVEGTAVNRVDAISDASRQQRVVARFEYDSQPSSLQLEITRKTTRITVEPIYQVDLQSNRIDLQAFFRYTVNGGKINRLEIDPSGWVVNRILPATLLAGNSVWGTAKPFTVPLALDLQGSFEVQMQASRELKSNELQLDRLPIPKAPQGANATLNVAPATIAITVADNIDLELLLDQLKGLVVEPILPNVSLPVRQQQPLVFREQPGIDGSVVKGRWKLRPRTVTVSPQHTISVPSIPERVETRFRIQVANEPLDRIRVEGIREVLTSDSMQASIDGQPVELTVLDDPSDGLPAPRSQATIEIPDRRLGGLEVILEYTPSLQASAGNASRHTVPLVTIVSDPQTVVSPTSLRLRPSDTVAATVSNEVWVPVKSQASADADEPLDYVATTQPDSVTVEVRKMSTTRSGTIVHRAWMQSWLSIRERRDRAVFYVTTNERRLRIRVPKGLRETDLEVALDRRPIAVPRLLGDELQIDVAASEAQLPHIVEIWCWMPREKSRWGQQSLETLRLVGASRVDRLHWEVALPPHELLLTGPADLVPEYSWQWLRGVWQRVAYYSTQDLEIWVGATSARPIPASTNRYLFSSLGTPERVQFTSLSRPWLVLLAAGPVLGIGLFAAAMRWWTRPMFLIALGAVLFPLALSVPDVSLLLGQASLLGFGLATLSGVWSSRRLPRSGVGRDAGGSVHSVTDSKSLEIHSAASVVGSSVRRSTAPLEIPAQAAETPP